MTNLKRRDADKAYVSPDSLCAREIEANKARVAMCRARWPEKIILL
jgi:hypothetical protein